MKALISNAQSWRGFSISEPKEPMGKSISLSEMEMIGGNEQTNL